MNNLLHNTKKILYRSPVMDIYSRNYLRYKFLSCKLKLMSNILIPEVHWVSTYNCNFHCPHCEASAGEKKVSELSNDEICKFMTDLGTMGVKKIHITGGEPLIRKDIFDVIHHILETKMEYSMGSNGYLVTKFKDEFTEMRPSYYFTSIDGLEHTNDKIRMTGAFKKTFEALEFFKSLDVKYRIINTLVIPENIDQLIELKKIIKNSSATYWRLAIPIPVGRSKNNEKMSLNNEQIRYIFNFVKDANKEFDVGITEDVGYIGCLSLKLRSRPFFCGAGFTRCSIMPDGEVLGCQIAYDNKYSEGNIRNKSFKEIWRTGFSRFRNPQINKEECITCKYFESCHGGCWGMRLGSRHCYKDIWEKECSGH